MLDEEMRRSLQKLVIWARYLIIFATVYFVFTYLFPLLWEILARLPGVILPFLFALLLALLIEPVINLFEKYAHFNRTWAVLTSLILVVGGVVLVVVAIVTVIIQEMSSLYRLALSHSDQIIGQIMSSVSDVRLFYLQLNLPPQAQTALQDNLQSALQLMQRLMSISINGLMQGLISLPGILIFLVIAAVAAFLVTKDRALIRSFIVSIFPVSSREQSMRVINDLLKALSGFVKAYSLLIAITGLITVLTLKLLGVEYAVTLGILIGLMDFMPIVGPGAILVPWIFWEFVSGNSGMGASLVGLYALISIVRQVLEPKIVGDSIGLHPLVTLMSLYLGLQLGGTTGMVLGPVVVVIFIACYRAGLLQRWDWRQR